ncbi:MAG TPA: hypothetical protein VG940_06050 [Gemmatimonadales bacterium]|nr:hypothetical protein [Gemmatimonadales bacterium]
MAVKLNSKQQAQLQFLEPFARQIVTMGSLIEQMSQPKVDEQIGRNLLRIASTTKVNCMGLGLSRMADTLGQIEQTARRTGGGLAKIRTLRELHTALKQAYDVAFKAATTEIEHGEEEPAAGGPTGGAH